MKQLLIAVTALLSVGVLGIALLMGTAVFFVGVVLPHLSLTGWCCFIPQQIVAGQPF